MASRDNDVTLVTKALNPVPDEGSGSPCLVIFYGDHLGRAINLQDGALVIGRSEEADIQVPQKSASRRHAMVETEQGRSRVVDLGSTNGTFVNDSAIESCELRDGDLLRVGQTIYKYLSGKNLEAKYHEEIYRLSVIDGLTGVYNKRHFEEVLDKELSRAQRYRRDLSLALFDVDHFKAINDEHGHVAGDTVLRHLAECVARKLRADDILCRYGGEEFALILPETSADAAMGVCEKIRALVEEEIFMDGDDRIAVTISIGLVGLEHGTQISSIGLVERADEQLYKAKKEGRNRVRATM